MNKLLNEYKGMRKEIYILALGKLVTSLGSMVTAMITLILKQKFNMNAEQIANILIFYAIFSIPANIIGGKLADNCNKRRIIIAFDLLTISLCLASVLLPLSNWTVFLILASAIFQTMENASYETLVADLTTSDQREKAYSLNYLGFNIGFIVAPTLGGLLVNNHLKLMFSIVGLSIAVSTLLIFFFVHDITPIEQDNLEPAQNESSGALFYLLKHPLIIVLASYVLFYVSAFNQSQYLVPLELSRIFGEKGSIIFGTCSSVSGLTVIILTPIITSLFSQHKETVKFVLSTIFVTLGFCIIYSLSSFIFVYYLAFIIFSIGEIFYSISYSSFLTKRVPDGLRGQVMSLIVIIYNIGAVVTEKIVSLYIDKSPNVGWILVIVLSILSVIFAYIINQMDISNRKAS